MCDNLDFSNAGKPLKSAVQFFTLLWAYADCN